MGSDTIFVIFSGMTILDTKKNYRLIFVVILTSCFFITFLQGRALSRAKSRRNLDYKDVLTKLEELGISIRVASPKLVMEEAPESYKNVTDVVNTCHAAGISKKTFKLRPIAVIKG